METNVVLSLVIMSWELVGEKSFAKVKKKIICKVTFSLLTQFFFHLVSQMKKERKTLSWQNVFFTPVLKS